MHILNSILDFKFHKNIACEVAVLFKIKNKIWFMQSHENSVRDEYSPESG